MTDILSKAEREEIQRKYFDHPCTTALDYFHDLLAHADAMDKYIAALEKAGDAMNADLNVFVGSSDKRKDSQKAWRRSILGEEE